MESMSNAPYLLQQHRWGAKMGAGVVADEFVVDGLTDAFQNYHMGQTAEILAERYGISREAQDEYSLQSHQKAARASAAGVFEAEIAPLNIPQKKGPPIVFSRDEHIRADTTLEGLAKLRPAFRPDGTVTAGNSSGINDGAAAVILADEAFVTERGLTPLFRIVSWGSCGVAPELMGLGPLPSARKALDRAGLSLADIGCAELNEAFAVQTLAVVREMGIDPAIVNANGGAIALGHPLGASGARILVTLAYEMARRGCRYGLAMLCIGGGMGEAMIIERV
jgi:acetyl-CoA C-acetyltransferase